MNCPYCNKTNIKVIDSRDTKDGSCIKRRRECLSCLKRFSTIEKILKLDLEVKKSNGKNEVFSLQKIKRSLLKAFEKRPITLEQIEILIENILKDLKQIEKTTIPTSQIGVIVLNAIKEVDEIAFLKYAIVHNNYNSMNDFLSELDNLKDFKKLNYKQ